MDVQHCVGGRGGGSVGQGKASHPWGRRRAPKKTFMCYDAKMAAILEEAWRQGPPAPPSITSRAPGAAPRRRRRRRRCGHWRRRRRRRRAAFGIIDLGSMVQTSVLTGEKRRVVR